MAACTTGITRGAGDTDVAAGIDVENAKSVGVSAFGTAFKTQKRGVLAFWVAFQRSKRRSKLCSTQLLTTMAAGRVGAPPGAGSNWICCICEIVQGRSDHSMRSKCYGVSDRISGRGIHESSIVDIGNYRY